MTQQNLVSGNFYTDGYQTTNNTEYFFPSLNITNDILGFPYNKLCGIVNLQVIALDVTSFDTHVGKVWNFSFGLTSVYNSDLFYFTNVINNDLHTNFSAGDTGTSSWSTSIILGSNTIGVKVTGENSKTIQWRYVLSGQLDVNYGS